MGHFKNQGKKIKGIGDKYPDSAEIPTPDADDMNLKGKNKHIKGIWED